MRSGSFRPRKATSPPPTLQRAGRSWGSKQDGVQDYFLAGVPILRLLCAGYRVADQLAHLYGGEILHGADPKGAEKGDLCGPFKAAYRASMAHARPLLSAALQRPPRRLTGPKGRPEIQAFASACSISAMISSMCSMPTDRRTRSSETPARASSSGPNCRCVVDAG